MAPSRSSPPAAAVVTLVLLASLTRTNADASACGIGTVWSESQQQCVGAASTGTAAERPSLLAEADNIVLRVPGGNAVLFQVGDEVVNMTDLPDELRGYTDATLQAIRLGFAIGGLQAKSSCDGVNTTLAIAEKADRDNVYTKADIDRKLSSIETAPTDVFTKAATLALLDTKADKQATQDALATKALLEEFVSLSGTVTQLQATATTTTATDIGALKQQNTAQAQEIKTLKNQVQAMSCHLQLFDDDDCSLCHNFTCCKGRDMGTGADGNVIISSNTNFNSNYGKAYQVTAPAAGATTLEANANADYAAGDELLLISLQGVLSDYSAVGRYEFVEVAAVSGSSITLVAPTVNNYQGNNQKVAVQRVPNFESLTINSGVTVQAGAWDGLSGSGTKNTGIVALRVKNTLTLNGNVDVSGQGFRAGAGSSSGYCKDAQNGEGVNQENRIQSGPGNVGGGAGGDLDGSWCVTDGDAGDHSPNAGGGGSHATRGAPDPHRELEASVSAYGNAELSTIFLGGGGGGSTSYRHNTGSGYGGAGGNGGGIIIVFAKTVSGDGQLKSRGNNGNGKHIHGGTGGGGAGGSVFLETDDVSTLNVADVAGGAGGPSPYNGAQGGAGSPGRLLIKEVTSKSSCANPEGTFACTTFGSMSEFCAA